MSDTVLDSVITMSPPRRKATAREGLVIQLASSLTIMGAVMVAPMLPKIAGEFAANSPEAAGLIPLVATGPALAIALFAPIAGWLADRYGRKRMLVLGSILYALFGVLPAFLHDLMQILFVRLAFGCAEAVVMTCCTTLIADYWTGEERSRYINRQVVTISIVGSIFFVIGGMVGETSWRLPFFLYLLPLLLLPAISRVIWEPEHRKAEDESLPAGSAPAVTRTIVTSYFLIFIGMVTSLIVAVLTPSLLVGIGITSSSLIGLCAGLGLLTTLVGSVFWPIARNRLGVAGVNAMMLTMMALGLYLLATAPTYTAILVAVSIHGVGAGFLVANASLPLLMTLPARLRARGVGGFTSFLYLGQFASPIIILTIAAALGDSPDKPGKAIIVWAGFILVVAAIWALKRFTSSSKTA
jgi:MFS family permease